MKLDVSVLLLPLDPAGDTSGMAAFRAVLGNTDENKGVGFMHAEVDGVVPVSVAMLDHPDTDMAAVVKKVAGNPLVSMLRPLLGASGFSLQGQIIRSGVPPVPFAIG